MSIARAVMDAAKGHGGRGLEHIAAIYSQDGVLHSTEWANTGGWNGVEPSAALQLVPPDAEVVGLVHTHQTPDQRRVLSNRDIITSGSIFAGRNPEYVLPALQASYVVLYDGNVYEFNKQESGWFGGRSVELIGNYIECGD